MAARKDECIILQQIKPNAVKVKRRIKMKLYTYCNQNDKFVYGTAVNGKSYFFFSGFKTAEEAKEFILSHYTGIAKEWFETSLEGEWSRIQ